MPAGTTDSLGRYYWCKTASTTDALRELRNQSILSFEFQVFKIRLFTPPLGQLDPFKYSRKYQVILEENS